MDKCVMKDCDNKCDEASSCCRSCQAFQKAVFECQDDAPENEVSAAEAKGVIFDKDYILKYHYTTEVSCDDCNIDRKYHNHLVSYLPKRLSKWLSVGTEVPDWIVSFLHSPEYYSERCGRCGDSTAECTYLVKVSVAKADKS